MPAKLDGDGSEPVMDNDSYAICCIFADSSSSSSLLLLFSIVLCVEVVDNFAVDDTISAVAPSGATKHAEDEVDDDAIIWRINVDDVVETLVQRRECER